MALSSILEVLRHPRSGSDELPPGGIPQLGYSVVWFNYVHFLASGPDRTRYYLIPGIEDVRLPAACLRLLPPSARREYEAEARAGRAGSVTLEAFNGEEESAATVYTDQAIEDGKTLLAATDPSNTTLAIAGVVPDGVASVTITVANGKTATGTVTNNLFLARPPAGRLKSLTVRWYAADGSLINRIPAGRLHSGVVVDTGGPVQLTVSPPPAVLRAGKKQLAEFELGRTSRRSRDALRATASDSQATQARDQRSTTSGRCSLGAASNTHCSALPHRCRRSSTCRRPSSRPSLCS